MTSFPYSRVPGRQGSGQVQSTANSIEPGAIPFWVEHLNKNGVAHGGVQERFGQLFLNFEHPSGLRFEVIEDAREHRKGWDTDQIAASESARGFNSTTFSVREIEEEERFLVEGLGFRKTGQDRNYHRYEIGSGGPGSTVNLFHEPQRAQGSWTFGAGTVHHVAFNVPSDHDLERQKAY